MRRVVVIAIAALWASVTLGDIKSLGVPTGPLPPGTTISPSQITAGALGNNGQITYVDPVFSNTSTGNCAPSTASAANCGIGYSNVMWQGAYADGQQSTFAVTASTSSNTITVSGASFSSADVGKVVVITGIGTTQSTGVITSAPVTTAGSYTGTMPILTATGSGTNAIIYPQMQAISATLVSGGAGCTNGTQTFTAVGNALGDTAAQFTGTVSGNALTGALTITVAGSYSIGVPPASAVVTGASCTTYPTVTLTYSVAGVRVTGSGLGWTSGSTSIGVSGGSPNTAAVIGTPVITNTILPLTTTITAVNSPTSITVVSLPSTAASGTTQTVFWGHDDLPSIQAALNTYQVAYLPNSTGVNNTYWVSGPIITNTQNVLLGADRDMVTIKAMPGINNHLVETPSFNTTYTGSSSGTGAVRIENITLDGNGALQWCSNPDLCNDVSLYGTYFTIRNVALNNSPGNGLRTVFNAGNSAPAGYNLESNFDAIWINTSQHHGWWNSGPHDCSAKDVIIISSSQAGDNTWSGLYNDNGAACRYDNIHPYSGAVTNFPKYQFSSAGSNQVHDSSFEGGRQLYEARGQYDTVEHTQFYNHYGAYGSAMLVVEANENHFTGSFIATTGQPINAIQFGLTGTTVTNNETDVITQNFDALSPINFLNDGGNFVRSYGAAAAAYISALTGLPSYAGTISGATTYSTCMFTSGGNGCGTAYPNALAMSASGSTTGWSYLLRNYVRRWGWSLDTGTDNAEFVSFENNGAYGVSYLTAYRDSSYVGAHWNFNVGVGTNAGARAVNTGTTSDTVAADISSTYESANTASSAFTVTLAAPLGDGERRRICFKNATGTLTWSVTSPATATSGLPTSIAAGGCTELVYNSASGTPTNAPATTWLPY